MPQHDELQQQEDLDKLTGSAHIVPGTQSSKAQEFWKHIYLGKNLVLKGLVLKGYSDVGDFELVTKLEMTEPNVPS